MAQPYTVLLPGGGSMTVNASDPRAAAVNAGQNPATATVYAGGHQTTSGSTTNSAGQVVGTTTYTGTGPAAMGGGTGTVNTPAGTVSAGSGAIDQYLQAIAAGNVAAAQEAIRQFNQTFGLDQGKFTESVRQYNANFGLAQGLQAANIAAQQAGLTGLFNGQPTLQAQAQQAQISGVQANGQPTESARQFNMTQGLAGLSLAASLNANPFRQAEALYGLSQNGTSPLMRAAAGNAPLPAFQAPTTSAADTRSLSWLASQGQPGSYTQDQSQQWLNGLPAPHQIDWNALGRATPGAQNLVVQGLSQKWGLDPNDIRAIGQATLPAFQAPTLSGRAA